MKAAPRSPPARPAHTTMNNSGEDRRATTAHEVVDSPGAVLLGLSPAASIYSVPEPPYNLLRSFFLVHMRLGVTWFFILEARVPQALLGMKHDLEVAVARGGVPAR